MLALAHVWARSAGRRGMAPMRPARRRGQQLSLQPPSAHRWLSPRLPARARRQQRASPPRPLQPPYRETRAAGSASSGIPIRARSGTPALARVTTSRSWTRCRRCQDRPRTWPGPRSCPRMGLCRCLQWARRSGGAARVRSEPARPVRPGVPGAAVLPGLGGEDLLIRRRLQRDLCAERVHGVLAGLTEL
jgi:hypothetical protein